MLGRKVFFVYFLFFYLIPAALSLWAGWHSNFINPEGIWEKSVIIASLYLLLVFIFYKAVSVNIKEVAYFSRLSYNFFCQSKVFLALSVLFLCVALLFKIKYGLSYRQSGPKITESGLLIWVLLVIKPICFSFVIFHGLSLSVPRPLERIALLVTSFATLLALVGAIEVVILMVSTLLSLSPKLYMRLSSVDRKGENGIINVVIRCVLIAVAFVALVFVGLANKIGIEAAFYRMTNMEGVIEILNYLYFRISVHAISLAYVSQDVVFSLTDQIRSMLISSDAIFYRWGVLTSSGAERPEITSINVLNYLNTYSNPHPTKEIGSSPGPLASFLYMPIFPISIIAASLYTAIFISMLDRASKIRVSMLSPKMALAFFLLMVFLYSPIDTMTLVGPALVSFLLYGLAILGSTAVPRNS